MVVVEASGRIGGRLWSADSDGNEATADAVKDELGGMRIFPSAGMGKVAELCGLCGLTLVPVPLGDDDNLFEYNGTTVRKGDAVGPSGRSYGAINAAASEAYTAKHNPAGDVDPYDCAELRAISVPTYLKKFGLCDEAEVDWWQVSRVTVSPLFCSPTRILKKDVLVAAFGTG